MGCTAIYIIEMKRPCHGASRSGLKLGPVHVRCVVHEVTLTQVLLCRFSFLSIIPPMHDTHLKSSILLVMTKRA